MPNREVKDPELKKIQIIQIIEILKEHSSVEKPLSRKEIQDYLEKDYKNAPSKKDTIANYMNALTRYYRKENDRAFIIVDCDGEDSSGDEELSKDKKVYKQDSKAPTYKYYYINNEMDYNMMLTLYYEVIQSKSIDKETAESIANKIERMMNKRDRKKLNDLLDDDGTLRIAGQEAASNLSNIKKAFDGKEAISFDYCSYNLKKELVKKTPKVPYEVVPLKFIQSAGKNYLIGLHIHYKEERTYRVDKMLNIKPIKKPNMISSTTNRDESIKSLVLMHNDKLLVSVKLLCEMRILDSVVEQFENCYLTKHEKPGYFVAHLRNVSNLGVRYWILQYSSACEVLSPEPLRDDVKKTLLKAVSWYE